MSRFSGQRVLITGGTQGIGKACALRFAAEGAEVILNYAKSQTAADKALAELRAAGGKAVAVQADLSDPQQVERLWKEAAAGGPVSTLILNAAFQQKSRFDDTDAALLRKTLEVNVVANFELARHFAAGRRAAKAPGTIIIHNSNQATMVYPTGFSYGISKAALQHLTMHLAGALVRDNIRVNGVLLGWFDTDGERKFYSKEQIKEQAKSNIPMGRAGEPDEAARLTVFLASEESSYITGSMLRCDGGFMLAPDLGT